MIMEFHHASPQNGREVLALRKAVRSRLFKPVTRKKKQSAVVVPLEPKPAVAPPLPQAWLTEEPFEHVKDYYAANAKYISPKTYIKGRCANIGISFSDLVNGGRNQHIVMVRQLMCYELRERLGLSWELIARAVGLSDHTTALYSWRKITRMKAEGTFDAVYGDGTRRYKLSDNDLSILRQIRDRGQAGTATIKAESVKHRLYCLRRNGAIYLAEGNPRYLWALTDAGHKALRDHGL